MRRFLFAAFAAAMLSASCERPDDSAAEDVETVTDCDAYCGEQTSDNPGCIESCNASESPSCSFTPRGL